jgi:hypothetical protein
MNIYFFWLNYGEYPLKEMHEDTVLLLAVLVAIEVLAYDDSPMLS